MAEKKHELLAVAIQWLIDQGDSADDILDAVEDLLDELGAED